MDDHWIHMDDHRIHMDDHWIHMDDHWKYESSLPLHHHLFLKEIEKNDAIVWLPNENLSRLGGACVFTYVHSTS
jgi:hypothetical protein